MNKEILKNEKAAFAKKLGFKNVMRAPRIVKIVISTGVGSLKDKKKLELIGDRLSKICGQKPAIRPAKKSIASFKVRQGDPSGYQVTLRGQRMEKFLDKMLNVSLPRTKDFRGISKDAIDDMGNITIGIKEHTVFPETADEELKDVFGMAVTIATTAKGKKEAEDFFEHIKLPFKKK
ncbi:MAG: 50S ribosomal protein L5 [Candidatus Taylorbacteria bacterium RIFCSPLOWO2_12_FULL_43_20]|uniref:Large ribosomal subunit protein uL5 n=1 Tax=Candidatus Taylorbacteria bacterium RIFCSPLOWO2_12_FULL_43_20 TaxID=1802332 RepID=A0A1G2P2C4_9BACT|nr:MAG: 50S ribosomal protein L5 [Candidatus Taylorbacteria bacterium RIFCSPHIGHO2_01_FULL_43_120]OHA23457.1 MAG: 50S ribosomal protein L5 [Candidatus Taylorbacteria bacterium RIFCSPHIGHO2_02_FULL_43_55]OHA29662.1 MAG: 50S ribosomal protein L5 [Candidatus Taylorbacteria bacterium RIFCSPHIGHO2_12_FULL_42_34]OHA31590.1 MAG: 50S ribosomal protein L5 [Candidatus Taylorbacteria bacterium RIFCSPLOWO2_01_FULL_43_83]OHA38971.1 MAG: 50S ribosomal protein L5 [Candidatus Taylorbacteria bacterium RIFCSPLOW